MPGKREARSCARGFVREMLWVTAGVVACGALSAGCSSQQPSVSVLIPRLDGNREVSFDIASCPHYPQSTEMDRVCMVDSNGKTYPQDGTLWTSPADPPYAVFYQFKPGYTPSLQDLDTTSDDPSIGVFAAPYVFRRSPEHGLALLRRGQPGQSDPSVHVADPERRVAGRGHRRAAGG